MPEEPKPQDSLFRPQALEHRFKVQGSGDVVRAMPRWVNGAFYFLVALFAIALIFSVIIQIPKRARAIVLPVDGEKVVLIVQGASAVDPGSTIAIEGEIVTVETVSDLLDPVEIRQRYGIGVTMPSVALTTGSLERRPSRSVVITLGRDPLIVALIPGLGALLGTGDG